MPYQDVDWLLNGFWVDLERISNASWKDLELIFWTDFEWHLERILNGPETDFERIFVAFWTDLERILDGSWTDPERILNGSWTDRILHGLWAVLERMVCFSKGGKWQARPSSGFVWLANWVAACSSKDKWWIGIRCFLSWWTNAAKSGWNEPVDPPEFIILESGSTEAK